MYDGNGGAMQQWNVPCTNEMVHVMQCNCHDAYTMMQGWQGSLLYAHKEMCRA